MSSAEEDASPGGLAKPRAAKKRRVALACDMCRRRKIRCDGKQPKCTSCTTYNWSCSYVDATKKFQRGYVEALEAKNRRLEGLIKRLHPEEDFTREVGFRLTRDNWTQKGVLGEGVLGEDEPSEPSAFVSTDPPAATAAEAFVNASTSSCKPKDVAKHLDDYEPSDDEENMSVKLSELTNDFKTLSVGGFHGKSSGARLLKTALRAKEQKDGLRIDRQSVFSFKRPEYWQLSTWEREAYEEKRASYTFPEGDLLFELVDAYFTHLNLILPVLHRPTLEAALISGSHLEDEALGGVVLLVCAIGARFCDDRRVVLDDDKSWHSAGWKYFKQVRIASKTLVSSSRLYDLQIACLGSIYLQGCTAAHACWNLTGIGIRLAQDVGAHRRKVYSQTPTVDDELFKRVFWVLVCLDRWLSAMMGRPAAIQEEDFDLDFPIDCDDEYWAPADPEQAFKQPSGKPSRITAFICQLKLGQVLGFALRTIYTSNKAKAHFGFVGESWESKIVSNFDSILNRWADQVPDYLRWDPNRKDEVLFLQGAHLWAQYYELQIIIHRPFISPGISTPLSYPSLAICANAARSASHVLDAAQSRYPTRPFPFLHKPAFTSAVVLLIGVWNASRYNSSVVKVEREMADIQKCLNILKIAEPRWHAAGRIWDILHSLLSVGTSPSPQGFWPAGSALKRPHEESTALNSAAPNAQSSPRTTNSTPSSLGHMSDTFGSSGSNFSDTLFSSSLKGASDSSFSLDSMFAGSGSVTGGNNDFSTAPGSDFMFTSMSHKTGGMSTATGASDASASPTSERPIAGTSRVHSTFTNQVLPVHSEELRQIDANDPMQVWGMSTFGLGTQTATSNSHDGFATSSMFYQGEPGLSTSPASAMQGQPQQQEHLASIPLPLGGSDLDFGALFGLTDTSNPTFQAQQQQVPLPRSLRELFTAPLGDINGSGAMDIWSGAGTGPSDWDWMNALSTQPGLETQMQQEE